MIVLQTVEEAVGIGSRLFALAALAGVVGLVVAALYRWYLSESVPQGVVLFIGASAIALALNMTATLGQSIGGTTDLLDPRAGLFTIAALLVGGIASEAGRHAGDSIGARFAPARSYRGLDREVSAFVRGGGRVLRVELPPTIADMDGYEPVRGALKEELAGRVLTFPGRLTFEDLHDAFVSRLEREFGIGKVDVEFGPDGTVEYLAVGRGQAGIGHTLQPGQVAIAIRADPAYRSSPGDQVRIWRATPQPERVTSGEVRGVVSDVVTVSVAEEAVEALRSEQGYKLETVPRGHHVDREFASILRRANESAEETTIVADSELVGTRVAEAGVTVIAIERPDGTVEAPPPGDAELSGGQRVVVIGRPDELRRFIAAAQGTPDPSA